MTNPFSGIITPELKTLFTNMIDSLLEDDALTLPCKLVYEGSKFILCDQCTINPMTGRSTDSSCPKCHGNGKISVTASEVVYMAVLFDYKDWIDKLPVNSPDGYVQTISKIDTLDNIRRTNYIIVNTDIENYVQNKFQKFGESSFCGFGASSYVVTTWKRV